MANEGQSKADELEREVEDIMWPASPTPENRLENRGFQGPEIQTPDRARPRVIVPFLQEAAEF
jgi:preprotein translocase subunit SecD